MADVAQVLEERKGPLPVWAWGLAGVAGLGFLYYFVKHKNSSANASSSTAGGSVPVGAGAAAGSSAPASAPVGIDLSPLAAAIGTLGQQQQSQNTALLSQLQSEQQSTAQAIAGAQSATAQLFTGLGAMIQGLAGHGATQAPVTSGSAGAPSSGSITPPVTAPVTTAPVTAPSSPTSPTNPFAASSGHIIAVDYGGGNHQVIEISDYLNMLRNGVGQEGSATYYPMGWSGGAGGSSSTGFKPVVVPNGVPTPVGWSGFAPQ